MVSRDQILAQMRERVHHPAGTRELLQLLKIPREERAAFKRHLNALVSSGDLIQIRGQRFGLPEKMDLYVGRLETHPAGYGFVVPERPLENGGSIYVSGPHLNEAVHGDRVVARIERVKEAERIANQTPAVSSSLPGTVRVLLLDAEDVAASRVLDSRLQPRSLCHFLEVNSLGILVFPLQQVVVICNNANRDNVVV